MKRTWTQKSDTSHSITKIRRIGDGYELGWSITFADDDARQLVIGTDGVTRVAYRRRSPSVECQHVLLQHGGDEGHWFGVQTLETAIYVHQADGASSATTVLPFEVGSEDWEGNQRFYAIRSDAGVVLYDRTTALLSAVPPGNFTSTPFLANEVVFMLRGVGNARVLWAFDPQNRSFAEILAPPPGRQIAEAESDGERLVWTTRREEDSGTFVDAVLFAAPLATTAEALEPIEIRALPSANFGRAAAGAGHFAILSGDYDALVIDVVRLDDGRLWEVPVTLEDDEFRQIVWVDETYLFYNSDKYLHRQSIADLGPGEP